MGKKKENRRYLTRNNGSPINNDINSLTVGRDGPTLLGDLTLIEKLASFDRERIPERVVHAKGAGAKGYFEVINCMKRYTKAKVFNVAKNKTSVTVRFSTVIGSKGSADTLRDPRGFATKFYTSEGVLDIVGNHIPVFFIRDAIKFPDMVHAFKPSPITNIIDKNRFWDFISSNPESTHMITFLFSDLGTVKSYRTINGFGVNTYIWVNEEGHRVFVKYHWISSLGVKTINRYEAELLGGIDPDVATRDLYDSISKGEFPEYYLKVQIMEENDFENLDFNPLDPTKVWDEEKFPLITVGKMILNENPFNFFGEIEQIAFCPANIVPGIELSNDKLLQGRSFSYKDTQRYRIGANFEELSINRSKSDLYNNNQDGKMRYFYSNEDINYKPNTLNDNEPKEYKENNKKLFLEGDIERKVISKEENFKQAGERYRNMPRKEKDTLIGNIVDDLWEVDDEIKLRAIDNFKKADKDFGEKVETEVFKNSSKR